MATPVTAEVLNIATIALPPYGYVEAWQPAGLNYELGNVIAEEAGYTPDNKIVPLARAMYDIKTGDADVIIMFPNPFINTHAVNLGLVLPMDTVVLGRADVTIMSIDDLRGKTVATVRGAKYDNRISQKNGIILYPTENYSQNLKMLMARRVDAVIGPILGLYYTARKNNIPKQAFGTPLILSTAQGSLFLSKKTLSADKKQRLTKAVKSLRAKGTMKMLLDKYTF